MNTLRNSNFSPSAVVGGVVKPKLAILSHIVSQVQSTSFRLSYTPNYDDGNIYTIEVGGQELTTQNKSLTVSGLTAGTSYQVTIRVSAAGYESSDPYTFYVTTSSLVVSLLSVKAKPSTDYAVFGIITSPSDATKNLTVFQGSTVVFQTAVTNEEIIVPSLTQNTTYTWSVQGTKSGYTSSDVRTGSFTTPQLKLQIKNVTIVDLTGESVEFSWTVNAEANNSYLITNHTTGQTYTQSTKSLTIHKLTPSTTYEFSIVASGTGYLDSDPYVFRVTTNSQQIIITGVSTSALDNGAEFVVITNPTGCIHHLTIVEANNADHSHTYTFSTDNFRVTDLAPNTVYNFSLYSTKTNYIDSAVYQDSFTTLKKKLVIKSHNIQDVSDSGAYISWAIEPSNATNVTFTVSNLTTGDSITTDKFGYVYSGLDANTTYNIRIVASSPDYLTSDNYDIQFTTGQNQVVINQVAVKGRGENSVTLQISTNPSGCTHQIVVKQGATTIGTYTSSTDEYTITGLDPDTNYTFEVTSSKTDYIASNVSSGSFSTLKVKLVVSNFRTTELDNVSALLQWAVNVDSSNEYLITLNGTQTFTTSDTYLRLTGLTPNTTYTVTIVASSSAYRTSDVTTLQFTTTYPQCEITSYELTADVDSVTLTLASTPVGCNYYVRIMQNGVMINEITTDKSSVTFSGLSANTTYQVSYYAFKQNWRDSESYTRNITTGKLSIVVSNLRTTSVGKNSIDIAWDVNYESSNTYQIYLNGVLIATVTSTSYTITGLSPNTEYAIEVQAFSTDYNDSNRASINSTTSRESILINSVTVTPTESEFTLAINTTPGSVDNYHIVVWTMDSANPDLELDTSSNSVTIDELDGQVALSPNTTYNFSILATKSGYNSATYTGSVTTSKSKLVLSSGVASNVTTTSATISFNVNHESGNTYTINNVTDGVVNTTSQRSYNLTGLTPNRNYTIRVTASSPNYLTSDPIEITFTTSQNQITINSVTVTPQVEGVRIIMGTTPTGCTHVVDLGDGVTREYNTDTFNVTGLTGGQLYSGSIVSKKTGYANSAAYPISFTPLMAQLVVSNIQITNITNVSCRVTWDCNHESNNTYTIVINGNRTLTTSERVLDITGFSPGTTYSIGIVASSDDYSTSDQATASFTTTYPQVEITNYTLTAAADNVTLSLTANTTGCSFYVKLLAADGITMIDEITTNNSTITFTGLTSNTEYKVFYYAMKTDWQNSDSYTRSITTGRLTLALSDLIATSTTNNSITIGWNVNHEDNNTYIIKKNGVQIATTQNRSYTLGLLLANTSYVISVIATSPNYNQSNESSITITTMMDTIVIDDVETVPYVDSFDMSIDSTPSSVDNYHVVIWTADESNPVAVIDTNSDKFTVEQLDVGVITPNTTYHYSIVATKLGYYQSAQYTGSVTTQKLKLVISNVQVTNIGLNSATISYDVNYEDSNSYLITNTSSGTSVTTTSRSYNLTGLAMGTAYQFSVVVSSPSYQTSDPVTVNFYTLSQQVTIDSVSVYPIVEGVQLSVKTTPTGCTQIVTLTDGDREYIYTFNTADMIIEDLKGGVTYTGTIVSRKSGYADSDPSSISFTTLYDKLVIGTNNSTPGGNGIILNFTTNYPGVTYHITSNLSQHEIVTNSMPYNFTAPAGTSVTFHVSIEKNGYESSNELTFTMTSKPKLIIDNVVLTSGGGGVITATVITSHSIPLIYTMDYWYDDVYMGQVSNDLGQFSFSRLPLKEIRFSIVISNPNYTDSDPYEDSIEMR